MIKSRRRARAKERRRELLTYRCN